MVEREAGDGDHGGDMPCIRIASEGWAIIAPRVGIPQCCDQVLAQGARTTKVSPCDCYAAETIAALELDESWRGCAVLMVCKKDTSPSEVLPYRLVYGIAAQRHNGPEMVDGGS